MDVASKLQIKPGQSVCVIGRTQGVTAAAQMAEGVRPVRQIAIDDVWSALRFRPA